VAAVKSSGVASAFVLICFATVGHAATLAEEFGEPPDAARPGVYWYFMDGNQDRDEMVADLEAMAQAGIGSVLFLEVNIGVPRGPVDFMSERWQSNFAHAVRTAERLGIEFILGTGPGWAGSGGPWVKPEHSMQHLVGSVTKVRGPSIFKGTLPVPPPLPPNRFSGMSKAHHGARNRWYRDVAVLAFPSPSQPARIGLHALKSLKDVQPYSINKRAPRFVPARAHYEEPAAGSVIDSGRIVDLTGSMRPGGALRWNVPPGDWTIMRFVARGTGQTTRPAPAPGHGFECDKFSAEAFEAHFEQFHGRLLQKVRPGRNGKGWTRLHLDSWEMSSQNWSASFREEFTRRRGYDPQPYYPTWAGLVVGSMERTERFLWDMRKTAQELVIENHAEAIKKIAHERGMLYSNEPYDMNPAGDLDLGSVADVPMCEFWMGFNPDTFYSCLEAVSIAHTMGRATVEAEAFTSRGSFRPCPANMKDQTDWALAMGINGIIFHTFQHQPLGDAYKPGMAMGPYGVNWHRNQTWWPMVSAYHRYIARASHMLRQGVAVADILYVTPEGAPHIFLPPPSALRGRDKKGYSFDAVSPRILMARAEVRDGLVAFPGGTGYRLLVLPRVPTMTPEALGCIERLVSAGATVVGTPPVASPSLSGYPACDAQVQTLARRMWGSVNSPPRLSRRDYGRGGIWWGGALSTETAAPTDILKNSSWIWYPEGNPAARAPASKRYFKRVVEVDGNRPLASARAALTADNAFVLWVNGKRVADGDNFNNVVKASIGALLRPGANTIAIEATNLGNSPNPAGLIAAFELAYADGRLRHVPTDSTWQASVSPPAGWPDASATSSEWKKARVLGPRGMSPWKLTSKQVSTGLYPDYDLTASILRESGIPEDFSADGPVRFGHRRIADGEIYFVSNTSVNTVRAKCAFRTDSGRPELWTPIDGRRRSLPRFTRGKGVTTIPLEFAPHEGYFVVFDRESPTSDTTARPGVTNFPNLSVVTTLEGPWRVRFDPARGGPGDVEFATLTSWHAHRIRGIKHYSGIATYTATFDLPAGVAPGEQLEIDIGTAHDMARVHLNGRELGIAWTSPWRLRAGDALKARGNVLKIEVANSWHNRLIGDQTPPDKGVRTAVWKSGLLGGRSYRTGRYTFATHGARGGLLPSGLIGPVRIVSPGPGVGGE